MEMKIIKNYGWVISVVIGVVVVAVGVVLFVFRKKIFGKDRNDYKRAREFTHEHDEKDMKEVEIENKIHENITPI